MSVIGIVARKEILDGWRDPRGMGAAMLAVLVGPIVAGVAVGSILARQNETTPLVLDVAGATEAHSLVHFLSNQGVEVRPFAGDLVEEVSSGRRDAALVIPEDYSEDFRSLRPARLLLVSDSTRASSRRAAERIEVLFARYARETGGLRLIARGIHPDVARPLRVQQVDTSKAAHRAGALLGVFVVYLLVAAFVAGMAIATDATAGERERATLEALLQTSAPPFAIALGKWLAVAVWNVAGFFVTLAITWAVVVRLPIEPIPTGAWIAGTLFAGVPLCLLAAGLALLVATAAPSFREGQTYASLLLMLPLVAGMLIEFSSASLPEWISLVPVVGHHQLFSAAIRGELPAWTTLAASGTVSVIAALLSVWALGRALERESIWLGR